MEENKIHDKIIDALNDADIKLSKIEFERMSESIIDYIDEIGRNK